MTRARDIANLVDANGDIVVGALDNVPASNDASALTTGTLAGARLPDPLPAIDGSSLTGIVSFASGTLMLFQQTAAPSGWTKQTTHNDKALRVVTGSAGSGGSSAFTTAFGTPSVSGTVGLSGTLAAGNLAVSVSGNIANTTLSTSQIPSHSHSALFFTGATSGGNLVGTNSNPSNDGTGSYYNSGSTGGGGAHNHGHNLSGSMTGEPSVGNLAGSLSSATAAINVQYVDLIIAAKD